MYLKLTNDHTASFYDNESMEVCFNFNPCHCLLLDITYCFETDITDDLRSFLKRFGVDIDKIDSNCFDEAKPFGVEMDEDVATLKFFLLPNGDIGPCS